ncbi:MAG: hypothetical protein EOM40_04870 [Clostridia bacterium]|nr:hypothetical protein [Clostridia bacterium]
MENSEYGKGGADMKKRLTNNLTLKIISVLIAIVIWLFASGASDPIVIEDYAVRVTVQNDDYIYNADKTYQINDEDRTVMVYITGKRSVVSNRSDIVVEADMTQIVDMDTSPAYVPLQFKEVNGISTANVNIIPKTIPVSIEEVARKDFVITVNTSGTPATGYEIGESTASLERVTIQGPKTTINKIKSVVATIDVSGISRDTEKKARLTVLDQNGETLTEDAMEYLTFYNVGEERSVDVAVKLWRVQDEIRVEANYSGTPAYGYQVDKVTTTPEYISVAGSEEALKKLEEQNNTIEIPAELINVDGTSQDLEANIKLNTVLKEEDGYKIPADLTQSVLVKISILPYGSKEFAVSTSDITVNGLKDGLRLNFEQDTITVRVKATDAELMGLKTEDIKASIDLAGKEENEYTLPITINLPSGYEQVEDAVTTVQLTKIDNTSE